MLASYDGGDNDSGDITNAVITIFEGLGRVELQSNTSFLHSFQYKIRFLTHVISTFNG